MTNVELTRMRHKGSTDRSVLDTLLDSSRLGHFALIVDGSPVILPTAIARDGDRVLAHGSTGSPWLRALADGAETSLAVTVLDALVVARSAFESSMNFRSAVLFGRCSRIEEPDEKRQALDAITESLLPGRPAVVRASSGKELAATIVLALPIDRWSLKVSDGWPEDGPDDVDGPAWAGVVPMLTTCGIPSRAPDLTDGIEMPPSVRRMLSPRPSPDANTP